MHAQQTEMMDVEGAITISDSETDSSKIGTIRFNSRTNDFEGFNGTEWLSLNVQDIGGVSGGSVNGERQSLGVSKLFEYDRVRVPGNDSSARFGGSVDIYDDYAVVGGVEMAYALKRTKDGWIVDTELVSDGNQSYTFGNEVAIDTNFIAVGDPFNSAIENEAGAVYLFERIGNSWTLQTRIDPPIDLIPGIHFGRSLAMRGELMIIGASNLNGDGSLNGFAYIFRKVGNVWTFEQRVSAFDAVHGEYTNYSYKVDIDKTYAAVSAPSGNNHNGEVYIYYYTGNHWVHQSKVLYPGTIVTPRFGMGLALQNDRLCVGAPINTQNPGSTKGEVYVFDRAGATWHETANLNLTMIDGYDRFGFNLSMDGDYIVTSSSDHETSPNVKTGAAFVFKYNGKFWRCISTLNGENSVHDDRFATGHAIHNNSIIIGAIHVESSNVFKEGGVYFY